MRLLVCAAIVIATADAGTHWVSPTGAAAWGACVGASPLAGASACSLATANANAAAGDVVYLRSGTYTITGNYATGLAPVNSGASGNVITFAAHTGEVPLLVSDYGSYFDQTGLYLFGVSYVKVDGIHFKSFRRWATLANSAHHNEVVRCKFYSDTGEDGAYQDLIVGFYITGSCVGGSTYSCYSTHNWVHQNTFSKAHGYTSTACLEGADVVRIGYPYGTGDDVGLNNNNTIEGNVIEYAGHALLDAYGLYNVVKNNVMHNEPWYTSQSESCAWPADYVNAAYDGKYGHRAMQITRDFPDPDTYVLVEGNRIGFASTNPNNDGADNIDLAASSVLTRYNYVFGSMSNGLMFKYEYSLRNKVYSNTFYKNGFGYDSYYNGGAACPGPRGSVCPTGTAAVTLYSPVARLGSEVVNNLIYDSGAYNYFGRDITVRSGGAAADSYITIRSNHLTGDGDPLFVNPSLADPTSQTLPDLRLRGGSTAIDAGTYLTQANGAGSDSTTLIVDDAMYFQDGTWGSDLARGVTFFPDWIAIGTVDNVVQISAIDYATNTITLASAKTWADNAPVWLYKKSDGAVVLHGSAPDYGASEFTAGSTAITGGSIIGGRQ